MTAGPWLVCAVLLGSAAVPAGGATGRATSAKSRPAGTKKKAGKRHPARAADFEAEASLHAERLATVARLKGLSRDLKDAELAATVERLERKEAQRHALAMQVLSDGEFKEGERR